MLAEDYSTICKSNLYPQMTRETSQQLLPPYVQYLPHMIIWDTIIQKVPAT